MVGPTKRGQDDFEAQTPPEAVKKTKASDQEGKVASVAARATPSGTEKGDFSLLTKDVRKGHLLPKLSMYELFSLGATSNENAELVLQEIWERHPSILEGVISKGVSAVLEAKHRYKDEVEWGKVVLSRGKWHHEVSAMLVLENPEKKPMVLPAEIWKLNMSELLVSDCAITALADPIEPCNSLTRLELSDNLLTKLPDSIGCLTSLRWVRVEKNQLTKLPSSIGNWFNLVELHCQDNRLKMLPPELGKCRGLGTLAVSRNCLEELTEFLGHCASLKYLYAGSNYLRKISCILPPYASFPHNHITTIPAELCTNVVELNLSHNRLNVLPSEIGACKQLVSLYLSHNQLQTIPPSIANCKSLQRLNLDSNELATLPLDLPHTLKELTLSFKNLDPLYLHMLQQRFPFIQNIEDMRI